MIITSPYYKNQIMFMLKESKKAINEQRNYYYEEADYDWNYQEFIDAIEDRLLDYGLDADEKNVFTMAERIYSLVADGIVSNIDMGLSDVVDDKAEELGII